MNPLRTKPMKRTILYNNKDIELVEEDGEYVLVKHAPKVKITTRSSNSDAKVLQSKNTVKSYLADCHMVYKVFDCPSINGKLLIFTTDGYDLRYCCGGHELTGRYLDEFMGIAEKEFNVKSYLYGEMREAPESGFILMSMNKHFPDMVEDDFCSRMEVETDDPKVKFHYYSFTEEQEPHSEIDMAICRKYKLNLDKMLGLYVRNYNVMGDWAFIEMPNWKIIPGSAYSKM